MSEPEIYCPLRTWRPAGSSRWLCAPRMGGCGTQWSTFWTSGICPGCGYRWEITVCLTCKQFSLHEDWYHWPETASDERRRQLETEQP